MLCSHQVRSREHVADFNNGQQRIQFPDAPSRDPEELGNIATMAPTGALGDVSDNGHGGASDLTGQVILLISWQRSGNNVRRRHELQSLLPDQETSMGGHLVRGHMHEDNIDSTSHRKLYTAVAVFPRQADNSDL